MTVAQFWAFATDLFNAKSGHRLLGVIAVGISAGAWIGSRLAAGGFEVVGPWGLMIGSAVTLVGVICLSNRVRSSVPVSSRSAPVDETPTVGEAGAGSRHWLGGFALIGRSRYLAGIAVLVVLLNWITSTGEFVLSDWVARSAQAAGGSPAIFIGRFMGSYSASITLVGFLIQLLLVSRIIVKAGLTRALMVTPIVFFVGYLLIGIVPVFALLQPVLVVQRSLDYSLLNTSRSALMLPTSRVVKYQAKTAIDTFCYRLGDLMSTATVFVGLRLFHDPRTQFIWLIVVLSATMTLVAWLIGREYSRNYGTAGAAGSARGSLAGNASGSVALQQ
jgi:AAA family ATP:ADP antiporter